LVSILHF